MNDIDKEFFNRLLNGLNESEVKVLILDKNTKVQKKSSSKSKRKLEVSDIKREEDDELF